MAATNQLEKIGSLVERLGPLSGKTRGMKIEADEWNTLVDTLRGLLEVEQVQEGSFASARDERFAEKEHQHLGGVTFDWLDADLQSRLEGGSSITLRSSFAELGKKVEELSAEVARLNAVVEAQQRKLDETSVSELDRKRVQRTFEERLAGVENLRTAFTGLSGQFQNLSQNVEVVVDLRKRLTDATGKPFDFADINRRLTEVQKLSDSLRGADNKPLRLRDFDVRLRDVENSIGLGGGGGLGGRFDVLAGDLETRVGVKVDERFQLLREGLAEENKVNVTRLNESIKVGLAGARTETETLVDTRVKSVQTTIVSQLDERLRTTGDQLRVDLGAVASSRVDARFGELDVPGKIKAGVASSRTEVETSLRTQLTENLNNSLTANLAAVEQRITTRVVAAEGAVAKATQELPARVKAEVAGTTASITANVDKRITDRLSETTTQLDPIIATKVNSAVASSVGQLNQNVETLVQQRLGDVNARVSAAVADGLKSVPNVVNNEVQTRFAALKLDDQLNRMRSTLSNSLTAEFTQTVAELRAKVTTSEASVNELRGQIAVSQQTANDANRRTLVLEQRVSETNKSVDDRIKVINTRVNAGTINRPFNQ